MAKYKWLYLDADTPLLQAALYVQESYVTVTHKPTGKVRKFKNQTVFWGHHMKKNAGWLADLNLRRKAVGKDALPPEDFEIENCVELRDDVEDHIDEAVRQWDFYIGRVKALGLANNYKACIGGEGNFRYDLAQVAPYKGHRPAKPILFEEVREEILSKYGAKIEVIDGCEADDYLSQIGWENYLKYKQTGKWEHVIGFIDKDLEMIIGPYFKFNEDNPEVRVRTPKEAAKAFCIQLLMGDRTDNIIGLPQLTDKMCDKYGTRKGKGLGEVKARAIIDPCESTKEMFERVVECYKDYYGTEKKPFETHRGEVLHWNYMDYLEENAGLLWLRRDINKPYSIMDSLNKVGIDPNEV